ncbi:glycosyltransferase family 2 protein [Pengzhenrongella sicca]|uniref:Glycosyltransferase family 2 protein n=1 Tax=Pengzhenrongella sicca TaxID=2819238 RepID=A0A8A4ZFJ6_9MICO|nr:glycosyltransferase family 2 protein [Pengzhenrongella sicca]QTE29267.1 glycosyltransferase family 2 protein [Pengzhenrongella sicca]
MRRAPAGARSGTGHGTGTSTRSSTTDVDVVIVGYRSRELLGRCLDALTAAAPGLTISRTVADNHSTDGTLEAVAARDDGSRAFDMGWNSGFARANNRAIALGDGRYVLVLNPDTVVRPGALTELVRFADAEPTAGVVAPRLLNADGTAQRTARAFPTPAAAVFGRRSPLTRWFPSNRFSRAFLLEGEHAADAPFAVDWVSGAAMLVPRAVIAEVGGFDEDYFLFWEDADWCRRIRSAGYGVWCVPTAVVVHDEGGSRGHGWSARSIVRFHRGAYLYWRKHHARHPLNPARWAGAVVLTARAVTLILFHQFARRSL